MAAPAPNSHESLIGGQVVGVSSSEVTYGSVVHLKHGVIIKGPNGQPLAYLPLLDERRYRLRCKRCGATLAKANSRGELAGEVKCHRCKTVNEAFLESSATQAALEATKEGDKT